MASSYKVAKIQDLDENQGIEVQVEGKSIAIFKQQDQLYAVENHCPHQGGPLVEGELRQGVVVCPWHAWEFDLKTGCLLESSDVQLETYKVRVKGEEIIIII